MNEHIEAEIFKLRGEIVVLKQQSVDLINDLWIERSRVEKLKKAVSEFIDNVENRNVYGGGSVREDGSYIKLRKLIKQI